MENLHADGHAPEVTRQQGDVEKGRGREAEQNGGEGVEERKDERVAGEIAADGGVPRCRAETRAVEDAGLGAVDEHAPEAELADDDVERVLADEELLEGVGKTVQRCAQQREKIALDGIARGELVVPREMVGAEEHAHTADTQEDTRDLGPAVAHTQEEKRQNDDDDDGPEVDELSGEDSGVAVGKDDEVVAFDVDEGEDEETPAVFQDDLEPAFEAELVERVARVDEVEEDVVEEGLEGGDRSALVAEELRERVRRGDADGKGW